VRDPQAIRQKNRKNLLHKVATICSIKWSVKELHSVTVELCCTGVH